VGDEMSAETNVAKQLTTIIIATNKPMNLLDFVIWKILLLRNIIFFAKIPDFGVEFLLTILEKYGTVR
jgi:hypothetical protein